MEVVRNSEPENQFLEKVRKLATDKGIVLIFDECTSGFRETYGGMHLSSKIYPDLLVLGKSLGNWYPITCVLGKKKYLKQKLNRF